MARHVDRLHPRLQAVDPQSGLLTPFFYKWLVQVYERIGGPTDFITELENGELYETGVIDSRLADQINNLKALENDLDTQSNSKIAALENRIIELQNELDMSPLWTTPIFHDFQLISTSTAFTTTGKQIIIVTSNVTITLNTKPKDGETVVIKRVTTAGEVVIDGGTINIDNATTYTLLFNYEGVQLVYSNSDGIWIII